MVKGLYSRHFVCLAALFIMGNAVITAPKANANRFNFLSFLICGILSLAVVIICRLIPLNKTTALLLSLLAFYCTADAFITFIKFISFDLLADTPRFLSVLPFVAVLLYIALKREGVLLKLGYFCFFFTAGVLLFFFFATLKDFNVRNIFIYELPGWKTLYNQSLPYLKTIILPSALLSFFAKENGFSAPQSLAGVGTGLLLLALCVLNSVLLFGIDFAGDLPYPYSAAGSTVTFGNLFTRMDGLLCFVYLSSCVIKCGVGIYVIKKSRGVFAP